MYFNSEHNIFQFVARHLRHQGTKALGPDGDCVLFAPDGRKCAIGCLLSTEAYNPFLEGKPLSHLVGALALSGIPTTPTVLVLLRHLQTVHDRFEPEEWPTILAELAVLWHFEVGFRPWGLPPEEEAPVP